MSLLIDIFAPTVYSVTVRGVADGFDPEQVAVALAGLAKRTVPEMAALLAKPKGKVIKRGLDQRTAEKYQAALTRIGCIATAVPDGVAAATPPAPQPAPPAAQQQVVQEASQETPQETPQQALLDGAARGDAQAQFDLGVNYLDCTGVDGHLSLAAFWVEKAVEQGHEEATYCLANGYFHGEMDLVQDYAKALYWARIAGQKGNAKAQYLLWKIYRDGHGVSPEPILAAQWLARARVQGYAPALAEND